jgi:hypothetical protein
MNQAAFDLISHGGMNQVINLTSDDFNASSSDNEDDMPGGLEPFPEPPCMDLNTGIEVWCPLHWLQ